MGDEAVIVQGDLNRSNIARVRKQSKSMQQATASLFSEAKGYGQQEDAHKFLTDVIFPTFEQSRLPVAVLQRPREAEFLDMPTLRRLNVSWTDRLALAVSQAGESEILDITQQTLKEANDTRWLSHGQACKALYKSLPAVLLSLEHERNGNF
ncbi:hypothetical protein Bbelb_318190 [Branchiostoma belcheri]|nr:hypothetical protein Bbelb_318190 [Branchiostoma belcheri]